MLTKEIRVGEKTIVVRETNGADEERVDRLLRKDKTIETPISFGTALGRALPMVAVHSVNGVEQTVIRDLVQLRERLAGFSSRELRAIEKAYQDLNGGDEGEANGDGSQGSDGSTSASPSQSTASAGENPDA